MENQNYLELSVEEASTLCEAMDSNIIITSENIDDFNLILNKVYNTQSYHDKIRRLIKKQKEKKEIEKKILEQYQ